MNNNNIFVILFKTKTTAIVICEIQKNMNMFNNHLLNTTTVIIIDIDVRVIVYNH